jgi:hypothetical protein
MPIMRDEPIEFGREYFVAPVVEAAVTPRGYYEEKAIDGVSVKWLGCWTCGISCEVRCGPDLLPLARIDAKDALRANGCTHVGPGADGPFAFKLDDGRVVDVAPAQPTDPANPPPERPGGGA